MTQVPFKPESQKTTLTSDPVLLRSPDQESLSKPISSASSEINHRNGQDDQSQLSSVANPGGSGKSLSRQLLSTVLPLALVPLAIASSIGYGITQNKNRLELSRKLEGDALIVAEAVSQKIVDEFALTTDLATDPVVLDLVRNGAKKAEAENLSLSQRTVNDIEDQYAKTKLLDPNPGLNKYLARLAKSEDLQDVVVTERHGLTVGSDTSTATLVQSYQEWWKQGKSQAQWVSNPTYASTGGFGITLSQQIQDPETGNFLGVLKVFVSGILFDQPLDYLAHTDLRKTQTVQLVDTTLGAVLVAYTDKKQSVPTSPVERLNVVGGSLIANLAAHLPKTSRAEKFNLAAVQRDLQAAYPIQNVVVSQTTHTDKGEAGEKALLVSFSYGDKQYALSVVPSLNWVAIASMDLAEINQAGQALLYIFGATALALGAVAAAITIGVSRRVASPLVDLSAKAQQVSAGNLDVMAEPSGSSETQTLAQTFNTLVLRVKGFLQEQILNTRRANLAADITGAAAVNADELLPVFSSLVDEARDILGSDRVVVYKFNADGSGSIVAESVASSLPSAYKQRLTDPCIPPEAREKYLAKGILLNHDVDKGNFHPDHLALLKNLKVKSILGIPVISQGKLDALLITHYCSAPHHWQPSEIEFFKQLGVQLGLVLERVKLLEQTQALAEEQRQIKEGLQQNALQLLMDVDPVSKGDLMARAKVTDDEIGTVADSYNATIASLRKIVVQVQDAADQVAKTTDTNETSVRALSSSAAQQAEEILSALERVQEMADSVQLVAANAEKAESAVQQAAQTVQEGDAAMNRTVDGILAIRNTVAETAKKVKRLGESSQKISNVVNLISGFAAQTNMLALNAAIEASRAGEDGKGFAVVAEEVRELARQSAEATTEIEKLVASIQAETNEVVVAMEAGTEQVVTGTKLVDETRQSLNKITAVSREISELVESIAQATVVQSQASTTVTETMTNVTAIANQNSVAANEVSNSFEQLRSVAQALQAEVGQFKVS
jgi:methyl-accepting chemotaxis protein